MNYTNLAHVLKYSTDDHRAFQDAIRTGDLTARKVYADYLEDNAPSYTTPSVINTLRNYEGPLWIGFSPKGQFNAIPVLTKAILAANQAGIPGGEYYHATSRNAKGRAHRVRVSGKMKTWKTDPTRFRVPWKFGLYDNGEFNQHNIHEWLTGDPTEEPT